LNVRKSRCHNYPPRWNGAADQELLVILRNHRTGELSHPPRWGFIAYFCAAPKGGRKPINAKCLTVRTLPTTHRFGKFCCVGIQAHSHRR